ncbi:damage-control phosphatase ARMT1-like [Anopheles ziemanni]|uniref:damage-control phosphatase ARMT1-like n=1 Tax=Anopheles coustani TaxID=139045 RepID=UPI00265AF34C|nr:damage-control phosphatase ARMT1-like [Anopheles coustani]XP_058129446.1 damage-control phosphatase ARMT1-like [Anopheles coustani]XP_058129447.1 damage-control phosphatase ARMT1-like [Anopheles coustani]XP_058171370.1 damage-control phosphatase ARMT1-like [Anopheles ziemanni]
MSELTTKYNIIDEKPPFNAPLKAQYKLGFGYYTMRERLPVILTQVIDQLSKDKEQIAENFGGETTRDELKAAIGEISKLKYELQTDKDFRPIRTDVGDETVWNRFIDGLGQDNSYFSACWLYAETYMYRRLNNIFENTTTIRKLDYFQQQKHKALTNSYDAMVAVLRSIEAFNNEPRKEEEIGSFFQKLLKLNLWGNRCDLSISAGQDVKQDGDPFSLLESLDQCIVSDHTQDIWHCLSTASPNENEASQVVEIINDNSGYELFTDLCLADYIVRHRLAPKVCFNVKAIPWYISDVTPKDMHWTLDTLANHEAEPLLAQFGARLKQHFETGAFEMREVDNFWTSPYEFYRMRDIAPALYDTLSQAKLLIFKGDLNYRKLLGDFNFPYTTPFVEALRGFVPTNLCTLRTVKADLICGLPEGLAQELDKKDASWMVTGEYGVIQFAGK